MKERSSGVLLHITSLPSPYGIGTLGKKAYRFVDFLKKAGQSYWQILPIGPTSYGDSPYQSFSTFAGNPYFIDLDMLKDSGYLKEEDYVDLEWTADPSKVDYGRVYALRYPVLRKAADRFLSRPNPAYHYFKNRNAWLEDYALFMALKNEFGGKSWQEWETGYKFRDEEAIREFKNTHESELEFWKVLQYFFSKQFKELKAYANSKGVQMIADCPIYVALDSADVWSHPELFQLDEELKPVSVAGCPPDAFTEDGQLWGNPLYKWEYHEETGYDWWIRRICHFYETCDVLRIDHFRGFDSYYSIPYGHKNAKNGKWIEGPGIKLFNALQQKAPGLDIIAEDLGYLTDSVIALLKASGYPGMRILVFGFGDDLSTENRDIPFHYPENSICYIGTHDNQTLKGWYQTCSKKVQDFFSDYCSMEGLDSDRVLRVIAESNSKLCVYQMQDLLGYGDESRMNTPSTLGTNWTWRASEAIYDEAMAEKLYKIAKLYGRVQHSESK